VCVLGESARARIFGETDPIGEHVKLGDAWFRVVGTLEPDLVPPRESAGLPAVDRNGLVYVPLQSALLRLEDAQSFLRDEIDGLYLQMESAEATVGAAAAVRGILDATHRQTADFTVIVPAELLAQQRRTQRLFQSVTVAIAGVSLLVGGIGIMNIMLASVIERLREIGIRRAVGAARADIARQFLIEAVLISVVGGALGIVAGLGLSRAIALLAGWSTLVTLPGVLLAFVVALSVGLASGLYPALKAAGLDPVEAIRS
jgi:putative ABC transport system permease protein